MVRIVDLFLELSQTLYGAYRPVFPPQINTG